MRWRRRLLRAAGVLLVLVGLATGLLAFELQRIDRFPADLPGSPPGGTTFLLIGSDSRAFADSPAEQAAFGSAADVGGRRADVVVIVRVTGRGVHSVVVPRDLLLPDRSGRGDRLALYLLRGPGALADVVCQRLGVGVDHVAVVDIPGFRGIVDAAGGVTVDVAAPIRDTRTGLAIDAAGRQRLDGTTALAYVRARHARVQDASGRWVAEPGGSAARAQRLAAVLEALGAQVGDWWRHPIRAGRTAHAAFGALEVSEGTGLTDFRRLARALRASAPVTLPVDQHEGAVPVALVRPEAAAVLAPVGRGQPASPCPTDPLPTG